MTARAVSSQKKPVAFLAVILVLLPVLLVALVLWSAFSQQIEDSYEKRLSTSLSVFELAVDRSLGDFRNSLSRLTADNTIQVTVDLDIRPQLKRYLTAQFEISNYKFVAIADLKGDSTLVVGERRQAELGCVYAGDNPPVESVSVVNNLLLVSRTLPLHYKGRALGYLCAGFAINSAEVVDTVASRIDGIAMLGWHHNVVPFGSQSVGIKLDSPVGQMFHAAFEGNHYRGMNAALAINGDLIQLGVLVDMNRYESVLRQSLWVIGVVVIAVLMITGFGLKMLGLRRRAEEQLSIEREKAVVTLASIADGVVTTDSDGHITYINPAAEQLLGETDQDLLGTHWHEIFDLQSEATGKRILNLKDIAESGPESDAVDSVLISRDGNQTAVHFSVAPIVKGMRHSGAVITFRDVRRERELKRRLAWKASRDDLTGLLNRSEFRRSVGLTIETTQDPDSNHCLLYIDLDEFKVVNDTCGHKAGDDLLRQVSAALQSQLREADTIARLGGDEFGVLLRNCPPDRGVEIANNLIEVINDKRFIYSEKVFHVGASIGLVSVNQLTSDLEDLIATVDAACYAAKEQGRNRVFVGEIDADKISHRMEELRQASHIRHALKENRLMLYKQSIVATDDPDPGNEAHAEILVRMVDENGELVVPGAFIPIAERHGLMQDIDRWIINHLFEREGDRLKQWRPSHRIKGKPSHDFVYSINLSGSSLTDPTFLDFVKAKLQEHQIPGGAVAFEITETQVITHLDKAVAFISALKEIGCKFLLDDFGSGMSSFGYLKNLPVDYLKIDGLFVKDIMSDPIDRSMVNMINEIGHVMGLTTIAEYVENDDIMREITEIGVDMAQGYSISRPQPIEDRPQLPAAITA